MLKGRFIKMLQMKGNVCLGILNGTEIGLQNLNLIGGTVFILHTLAISLSWFRD